MKKTNTKKKTRTQEIMLSVRIPKCLFASLNKVSNKICMTRSDLIRTILQRDIDKHPLS